MRFAAAVAALCLVIVTTAKADGTPACTSRIFEASRFTVCAVDTRLEDVSLAWADDHGAPLRSFARLASAMGTESGRVAFAMNAGMFDQQGRPIGLLVEDGVTRSPINTRTGGGNFYMKPNGIFWMAKDGTLGLEPTDRYTSHQATPRWATQSGPMLVIEGGLNPQIAPDGTSKFVRNGVGVSNPHSAFFVISEEPVSFGRMARLFRDALGCPNALYFDGAVSSLWAPALGRRDDAHDLGPLVVVTAH
jgi:uncharacterized protein YigE (DUF2233 family)